jgi:hypothetical protein
MKATNRFKVTNNRYFDLLKKRLVELGGKVLTEESRYILLDGEFALYLARATGLKSKKSRLVKKRAKAVFIESISREGFPL